MFTLICGIIGLVFGGVGGFFVGIIIGLFLTGLFMQ